jgi:hypothetical protein
MEKKRLRIDKYEEKNKEEKIEVKVKKKFKQITRIKPQYLHTNTKTIK